MNGRNYFFSMFGLVLLTSGLASGELGALLAGYILALLICLLIFCLARGFLSNGRPK